MQHRRMTSVKYCQVCTTNNKKNKLVLRQINFRQAVYLCEDEACTYPNGHDLVEVQERTLSQLSRERKQQSLDKADLDAWLENFFADEDKAQNDQNSDDGIINDDDLSKIIDEISKPANENDVDLQYDTDLYTWIDNAFEKCSLNKETFENRCTNENSTEININKDRKDVDIDDLFIMSKPPDKNCINLQCDNDLYTCDESTFKTCNLNSATLEIQSANEKSNKIKVIDKVINNARCNTSYNDKNLLTTSLCNTLTTDNIQNSKKSASQSFPKLHNVKKKISTQPTQYRILNFEQFKVPPITYMSKPYKTENQANMVHNKYEKGNVLPPKQTKIILKSNTSSFKQDSGSSNTPKKFKDFHFVNILLKPPMK